jgi:tripartite-type tricarboxylate transporter receptor subunit TctC
MRCRRAAIAGAATLTFTLASGLSQADSATDFFKGRQISLVLSTGEGGGHTSYATVFANHFTNHIPGNPKIVIQYMPGAGGIKAMNYLYSVAPKDGATLGFVHASAPFAPLYGVAGAKFDSREMNWIGSLDSATGICVAWHTARVETWQDLFDKDYVVGGAGVGSEMETLPLMLNKLFNTKIKIVSGYRGGNEVFLAMERGEVKGRCGGLYSAINSTRPEWFAQKKVTIPVQFALTRDPRFPDTAAVGEYAKDEKTKHVLQLIFAPQEMDRPILAPPGVPPERVAALRAAFHATMQDPAFLAEAKRREIEVTDVSGERLAKIVRDAFALPPDVIQAANDAMSVSGTTEIK